MANLGLEQNYRYPRPSALESGANLALATYSPGADQNPYFFSGQMVRPERTAQQLLGLMDVVHARYHTPPAMLERILAQADPVVTCGDDRLRFEGFSTCCSTYVRVDLHPPALKGERHGRGTTNVDFNQPMLSALSKVRNSSPMGISVGSDAVEVETESETIIERKVTLPMRWLKGFVEVQACQERMQPVHKISGGHALRFLRGLPRMKTHKRETWIVRSGQGLRLSQVKPRRGDSVRVGGLERLRVLQRMAPQATALEVYGDPMSGATGWVLVFDDSRFQLLLSPEVWRGFSGEGQALETLASDAWKDPLRRVQAQLTWHAALTPEDVAAGAGVSVDEARASLTALGARGLVGFDLDARAYFHRILPFDLSKLDRLQPRLVAARKLVDTQAVQVTKRSPLGAEAFVASLNVEHRVTLGEEADTCTCPWFAKHQNERGPCKHILATRMTIGSSDDKG